MKKRWGSLLLAVLIALFGGSPSLASAAGTTGTLLFHDSFDTTAQVDMIKTTADVNTAQGWIDLACNSGANAIAASGQNGSLQSIVAVTQSGIQWFSRDQFSSQMVQMKSMTLTSYASPMGITLAPDNTLFVYGKSAGQWYVHQALFDGAGLVDNPKMSLSLSAPITGLTAISGTSFAVADKTGNITVYNYDSNSQSIQIDAAHSFSTGMTDIVSIKSIPNTFDFYVITHHGSYRYSFDQASGTDLITPAFTVSAAAQIIGGDGYDNLLALLDGTTSSVYGLDQSTYTMTPMSQLSIASLTGAFDVSMPSETTEVIASKDGTIQTYQYDPSTNQMAVNQNLEISGLAFSSQCITPGLYQSTPISSGQQYNMFDLVPSEQDDAGTSITYALSADGGVTFTTVAPNAWIHLPSGSTNPPSGGNVPSGPFLTQAALSGDANATPRLTDLELYGYLDVTPPSQPGAPYGSPDPSYSTSTSITWSASTDPIQSPSTGSSGIARYYIRYSTDGGATWTNWIDTKSNSPGYNLSTPENTSVQYLLQVMAEDAAGNQSSPSAIGSAFVDTNPLTVSSVVVSQIMAPSNGQAPAPTTQLPVHVQAGGEVEYQVSTTGHAESVSVTYSDGTTQDLVPQNPISSPTDANTWTGFYYPSSQQTIPLGTPQGTDISLQDIQADRSGGEAHATSSLLIVSGSLSGSSNTPFLPPKLSN